MAQEDNRQDAERWGAMGARMDNMADDIVELKTGQEKQGKESREGIAALAQIVVEQGKEITKLRTQVGLAGAFGGMAGSLIVGLILLFAQKGSP